MTDLIVSVDGLVLDASLSGLRSFEDLIESEVRLPDQAAQRVFFDGDLVVGKLKQLLVEGMVPVFRLHDVCKGSVCEQEVSVAEGSCRHRSLCRLWLLNDKDAVILFLKDVHEDALLLLARLACDKKLLLVQCHQICAVDHWQELNKCEPGLKGRYQFLFLAEVW